MPLPGSLNEATIQRTDQLALREGDVESKVSVLAREVSHSRAANLYVLQTPLSTLFSLLHFSYIVIRGFFPFPPFPIFADVTQSAWAKGAAATWFSSLYLGRGAKWSAHVFRDKASGDLLNCFHHIT